jgi:hypothetical protein
MRNSINAGVSQSTLATWDGLHNTTDGYDCIGCALAERAPAVRCQACRCPRMPTEPILRIGGSTITAKALTAAIQRQTVNSPSRLTREPRQRRSIEPRGVQAAPSPSVLSVRTVVGNGPRDAWASRIGPCACHQSLRGVRASVRHGSARCPDMLAPLPHRALPKRFLHD